MGPERRCGGASGGGHALFGIVIAAYPVSYRTFLMKDGVGRGAAGGLLRRSDRFVRSSERCFRRSVRLCRRSECFCRRSASLCRTSECSCRSSDRLCRMSECFCRSSDKPARRSECWAGGRGRACAPLMEDTSRRGGRLLAMRGSEGTTDAHGWTPMGKGEMEGGVFTAEDAEGAEGGGFGPGHRRASALSTRRAGACVA